MERFLLFGGDFDCAMGGMWDFVDSHATRELAVEDAKKRVAAVGGYLGWWHVYDSELKVCVARSEYQTHGIPESDKSLPLSERQAQ